MPLGPSATSSTLRGIGNEVSTTSQVDAICATDVPAVAPRSVQALMAAGLRSNTTTSWLVLRMILRHMGPPMFPTPMKPTFIAVSPPGSPAPACPNGRLAETTAVEDARAAGGMDHGKHSRATG